MLLGFKTELHPNNQQKTLLAKHAGVARHAWNWGLWLTKNILNYNQHHPDSKIKFPSAIDLHKLLVAMVKPHNCWYYCDRDLNASLNLAMAVSSIACACGLDNADVAR
jgi:putative transposase